MTDKLKRDLTPGCSESSHLVMPNDTNPLGTLFGGRAVEWMDIAAGLAAIRLSHKHAVTASIERLDLSKAQLLGAGAYGKVYAVILEDGTEAAVKIYEKQAHGGNGAYAALFKELTLLRSMEHELIVRTLGHGTLDSSRGFIALELCRGLSLRNW